MNGKKAKQLRKAANILGKDLPESNLVITTKGKRVIKGELIDVFTLAEEKSKRETYKSLKKSYKNIDPSDMTEWARLLGANK